eukprot:gene17425-23727_t
MSDLAKFYQLSAKDIKGTDFDFKRLQGKVVIVVNVASNLLEFSNVEEPGSDSEIESFCMGMFGVTFPMMAKVDVNGSNAAPVYQYLKKQKRQFWMESIKWNFEKFIINHKGQVVLRYTSMADPKTHLEPAVAKLLAEAEAAAAKT